MPNHSIQFTADEFTGLLEGAGVLISKDDRGRALDNIFARLWCTVKYEHIYLYDYDYVPALETGCTTTSSFTITSNRIRTWATGRRPRCTMPEWCMAGLPEFDSRHGLSYDRCGRAADEQRLPKPVGVHLILPVRGPKDGANLTVLYCFG